MTARRCDAIAGCVVIPVFNHARTVGEVVKGSLAHASTVLVCDDGSSDGSGQRAKEAGAEVLTHPVNQGKGAALRTLFDEAVRRGFRYAICLDADGQHLPDDISKVVEEAARQPGAIVVGARDLKAANAPASSEFGRKFSNFWVWFESGAKVEDSQCGFRAYPLPETQRLSGSLSRYDFEVEVLLRAAWAGVPIASTPIGVVYPEDRVTHFRPFADNARISLLNTLTCLKLLLPVPLAPLLHLRLHRPGLSLDALRRWAWLGGPGPLGRAAAALLGVLGGGLGAVVSAAAGTGALPALLGLWLATALASRGFTLPVQAAAAAGVGALFGLVEWRWRKRLVARADQASPRAWTGRTRGGVLGNAIMVIAVRFFGARLAYLLLYPVAFYFTFAAPEGRRAIVQYFERLLGPASAFVQWKRTWLLMLWFARGLVDRLVLGARGREAFSFTEDGVHHILEASNSGKGSLLLTAHIGNYDLAGGLLHGRLGCQLSLVAFQNEAAAIRRLLDKRMGPQLHVVEVGNTELGGLDILRVLRSGNMVAMQGDRSVDERVARVPFLGAPAAFPVGPFFLAAVSGVPVISTFCLQVGPQRYEMVANPPRTYHFEKGHSRDEQLQQWVADYARQLEDICRRYPYQWFNFYDFWAPGLSTPAKKPTAEAAA